MTSWMPAPFLHQIGRKREELEAIRKYPLTLLADILREVGFSCNCCAKCCTRAFNGHVLLLEEDCERIISIDPSAIEPPPVFDFCDQHGIFYVSGFTIKSREGVEGPCHFLEGRRCHIYQARPRVCRIYPYMLHREPGPDGVVDWRQISGLNEHGEYHSDISKEEAYAIARDVLSFEEAVITEEIAFLEYTARYFQAHGLRHIRKRYDDGTRALQKGNAATVLVYFRGSFKEWIVQGGKMHPA